MIRIITCTPTQNRILNTMAMKPKTQPKPAPAKPAAMKPKGGKKGC